MRDKRLTQAFACLDPDPGTQERIWKELIRQEGGAVSEKQIVRGRSASAKIWRTVLLAAVLTGAMGITAFAAGLFGKEALQVQDPEITPQKLVIGEDQKGHVVDNPEQGAVFSITQPQEVPEELDPAIAGKVENNKAAWAEWQAYLNESGYQMPEVFDAPEGARKSDLIDNGDGSFSLVFSRPNKTDEELTAWTNEIERAATEDHERAAAMNQEYFSYWEDEENWVVLETRPVTAEEKAQYDQFMALNGVTLDGYDHNYMIRTEEQAQKLEEIAKKYGLELRREQQIRFGTMLDFYKVHGRPDWMSDEDMERMRQEDTRGLSTSMQLSQLSAACCRGELFLSEPAFVDHLYWFQEGTFGIFFTWRFADGKLAECYLYNSMYGTMSSGMELYEMIEDASSYSSRSYASRDGAEVTILESGHENAWGHRDSSFLYVYLPDSFLVIKVDQFEGLRPEELNQIADSLQYSAINVHS